MSHHRHPDSALISQLGNRIVKDTFGLSDQSVINWRIRGVPAVKRFAFAELCAEHAVPVPDDFLAMFEHTRPC